MLNVILTFLIIFFSFLSTTIISFNLIPLLIISSAVNFSTARAFFLAFLAGLIFDLVNGNWVGLSSLVFLIMTLVVSFYRAKFRQNHLFYSLIFAFLSLVIINYLSFSNFFWWKSLLTSLLVIPINLMMVFLKDRLERN